MRNVVKPDGTKSKMLAFDIETRAHKYAENYFEDKDYKAPGNYKKQDAIDKYIDEARAKDLNKAALYIPTQSIWVISFYDHECDYMGHYADREEAVVVKKFFHDLNTKYKDHVMYGFNSRSFDFPCLIGAALRNALALPSQLIQSNKQSDILDDFYHTKLHLSDIAYILGKEKLMNGGEVENKWREYTLGNEDAMNEVISYCDMDVEICVDYVRRLYHV